MAIFFGVFTLIFIVFSVWRFLYNEAAELQFRSDVYELRDELRRKAISGEVDKDSWLFDFLDNSFSKGIAESYYITLFRLILLDSLHDNEKYLKFSKKLEKELKKNPVLADLRNKYFSIIFEYIKNQHSLSVKYIIGPILMPLIGSAGLVKKLNVKLKQVLIFPETSDSASFV